MRAKVLEVLNTGLRLALEGDNEGWLASDQWSSQQGEWDVATLSLDPGDELDVMPLPGRADGRVQVTRKDVTHAPNDSSWVNDVRDMRVDDVGKTLIRGTIGAAISAVVSRQSYLDWIDKKHLSTELLDHAVLSRGDTIRGFVKSESMELGSVELDVCEYFELQTLEIAETVEKTLARKAREQRTASKPPARRLRDKVATSINPVLLADDNQRCRDAIAATLRRQSIEVQTIEDAEQSRAFIKAIASRQADPPRMAIVDPNLDTAGASLAGLELARELRASDPRCRVILMTGEVTYENKLRNWSDLQIHGYIEKPFTMDLLLEAIDEAVALDVPVRLREWLSSEAKHAPVATKSPSVGQSVSDVSIGAALQTLVRTKPGTVAHVFELHPRSLRARSVAESSGGLKWAVLRGKIGKSVIKDAALANRPLVDGHVGEKPEHLWTRQMMDYESFCGVPVHIKGRLIALVAFHPEQQAFDSDFVTAARLAAEQVGRDLERQSLVTSRRHESTLASSGMAMASLAHELASDLVALHTELGEVEEKMALDFSPVDVKTSIQKVQDIREHVAEMTERTRTLRGVRPPSGFVSLPDCLNRAVVACRMVIAQTIEDPARIVIETSELPDGQWNVSAPASSLVMVFFNLYLNAAQQIDLASRVRRQGKIWTTLSYFLDGGNQRWARVRVHDSGPGIHHDDWERIFDAGYSTKPNGSGLGLYICRYVLRDLSATVSVTSSRIWDGTTVTVNLKLA